jgi:hypothetical protein
VDFFPLCSVFKTNGTFFVKLFEGHEFFADLLKKDLLIVRRLTYFHEKLDKSRNNLNAYVKNLPEMEIQ